MKKGRKEGWLKSIISILWLFSMALAGFFVPHFTDSISFFKIKTLHLEGLESIPPDVVVEEVRNLKNNWLFINSSNLLENLNKATGNSISELRISRTFSSEGVELKVKIRERKPIFTVIEDDKISFFDENGVQFYSPFINIVNPVVYTHKTELISNNFEIIKSIIKSMNADIREIYITNLGTIIYTKKGLKITLPPLFLLNENLIKNLAKIHADYNTEIEMQEVEISTEGLVVIRGEKKK